MKRWIFRLLVLAVLVAAGVGAKLTILAPEPVEVAVHTVGRGPVESTVTNTRAGTITARRRAELSPEIGGRVIELPFDEGDRVEAGALLMRLDDRVPRAQEELTRRQLESAQARLAEARLVAERAERELERNARLSETNLISDDLLDELTSQRDRALLAVTTSQNRVAEARAQLHLVEAQLAQSELRAPFAGVIARLEAELGVYVSPSPPGMQLPSVVDLIDPTSIYIRAPMDEVDSAVIEVDMKVRVTIDPFPGREFEGHVVRIAPYVLDVKEQNRTLDIEVELEDRELSRRLLPGTSADVEVILTVEEDSLRIPTATLLEGRRVLVFEDAGLVDREVEVGLRNWNWTSIRSGLSAGELVVTTLGSEEVQPGVEARRVDGESAR